MGAPVDFTFSADQDELRRTVRSFMDQQSPPSYMRAMIDDERGFTDDVWDQLVELGWPALLVPEADNGLGLGLVDLVVVMEEMGRVPFPGPYFSSAVFATLAAKLEPGVAIDLRDEHGAQVIRAARREVNALSVSRTLALAFFLAQLEHDPDREGKIVVFDDPFNSQDGFRKDCTIQKIKRCGAACTQVIS